jgi:hypothetical protein
MRTLLLFLTLAAPPEAAPKITVQEKTIVVAGLDRAVLAELAKLNADELRRILPVRIDREGSALMLGTHRVRENILLFEPRFGLSAGVRYRVVFDPTSLKNKAERLQTTLEIPEPIRVPRTVVRGVYPSSDKLPENQLKFYIHFSAAMRPGDAYKNIHLLDEKNKAVDLPFLELDQELWNTDDTRFTLFFDPGRIKRGLKPREDYGPALIEGKKYTLVLDRAWLDADGQPLKESFRKSFTVGPPDDTQPDPKTWKLSSVKLGSRDPLQVTFPKAMDSALLQRWLWVQNGKGEKVATKVLLGEGETSVTLTPNTPWDAGEYHLLADTRLEDLSGNSIGRPFEVDLLRPVEKAIKAETVKIGFRVK